MKEYITKVKIKETGEVGTVIDVCENGCTVEYDDIEKEYDSFTFEEVEVIK